MLFNYLLTAKEKGCYEAAFALLKNPLSRLTCKKHVPLLLSPSFLYLIPEKEI